MLIVNAAQCAAFVEGNVSAHNKLSRKLIWATIDAYINRLHTHLPGQHMVTFNPNEDPEVIRELALSERSTLTAFFDANADEGPHGEEARNHGFE